ncbi:IclR family transcriptional regulator [Phytoactinopolyspora mesophila]|uniref:Glycerol operon regulatory protein n=1 Tax=Phytoactinopolyspora mesophila TaxID=2650750 RepID=A0A7K3M8T4_9ACTN|nr:IclR family transcriptional regulator [Phytoactinopolyspora mesophila]NDL58828.1 helix-turn-helix domain-containing protein [Phytoactinopolyspora mesophila]
MADAPADAAVVPPDGRGVKSAGRTVKILEALAGSRHRVTMSELQAITGYPRSSLHALIRTLRDLGWVEADETGSAFTVGPRALLAGTSYLDKDPALPHVHATLEDLRDELGYTFHFARRVEANVLYLASREARDHTRTVSRVGRQLPAHITALGHALLAELTEPEVDAVLPDPLIAHTPNTITDRAMLHRHLESVRTNGWAVERQHGTIGVACVATAVGYRIPATDAISCSMPAGLASDAEVSQISQTLVSRAQALAARLRREGIR